MKKRLLAMLLCAVMAVSVCACGTGDDEGTENSQEENNVEQPYVVSLAEHEDLAAMLTGNYEITEERIESYYRNIMYNAGEGVVEVTDRDTVQAGDIVKLDYTGYLDGEAFSGGSTLTEDGESNPQMIDVDANGYIDSSTGTRNSFIEGFTDGLIGAKKGETVDHNVTFPENYNTTLGGKETTFKFTIHGIYRERTPETLTDEFVSERFGKSYEVYTADEFMNFVKEDLVYVYVMNYLIENSEVKIPESYLNARLDSYMEWYIEFMFGSRETFESALSAYGITESYLRVQLAEDLEDRIKEQVIFEELVKQDKLTTDQEAVDQAVQSLISVNSSSFPDEEAVYEYRGYGDAEVGKTYLLNVDAVRKNILEKYRTAE